jgi:hypothetical protein
MVNQLKDVELLPDNKSNEEIVNVVNFSPEGSPLNKSKVDYLEEEYEDQQEPPMNIHNFLEMEASD